MVLTYNYVAIRDDAREKFRGCTKENANLEHTSCSATSMFSVSELYVGVNKNQWLMEAPRPHLGWGRRG